MGHSIWQNMQQKGYSRRDFIQFCAAAATMAGLGKTGAAQVVSAFEKKEKPAVVWMHFQECTCCSESFIRASHPIVADALLDVLSLNYTETLMAASGFQAEKSLNDTIANNKGKYIVLVEGAVPTGNDGVYCMIGGKTAESILQTVAKDAAAVVAWGSCASNGCVQAAKPNPTGATPIHKLIDKPVINVPGCPPIADVMMAIVTHLLVLGQLPALDNLGRPKEFYGRRVHDTCYRRPNYDAGLFVESFDDENARKGYCLVQNGLPRSGHLQRLLGGQVERGHKLSHSIRPWMHRLQRRGVLGQRTVLPAPRILPRLWHREHGGHDRHGCRRSDAGRSCRARGGDQRSQAQRDR